MVSTASFYWNNEHLKIKFGLMFQFQGLNQEFKQSEKLLSNHVYLRGFFKLITNYQDTVMCNCNSDLLSSFPQITLIYLLVKYASYQGKV